MATRKATTRVAIEGEKEYKDALSSLASGSKTLTSEMKLLQAQYKGNTESTEFLTNKAELLGRQLKQQEQITAQHKSMVEKASKTLEEAAAEYQRLTESADSDAEAQERAEKAMADADKQLQKYMTAMNNSQAEEYELRHSIDETNESLDQQGETAKSAGNSMKGLGDVAGDLTQKFGIQLPDGAKNALNGMKGLSAGTVAAMSAAVAAVVALVKTVKALQETTIEAAARADEILTKSVQMNISTQLYQQLQYASEFVDVSVDDMAKTFQKLTKQMAAANDGNKDAQKSFADLGVSITNADGSLRDAYDVWMDTLDALSNMSNETERDAAAMKLLGDSATSLSPIYREGTDALKEYTAAAGENYVMSEDQLETLGRVDDAVQKLTRTQEANKNMIAAEWAPTAEKALTSASNLLEAAGKALENSGLISGFGELVQFAVALIDPITSLLNKANEAPQKLGIVYQALHGIAGALAWIADAANVVIGMLETLSIFNARSGLERIGTALGYGASYGNYSNMQKWMGMDDTSGNYYNPETGMWEGNYGRNAIGTSNWRGGLTWVGENGPELVSLPRGSQIMTAQESRSAGGDVYIDTVVIDAKNVKDFQTVVALFQSARVTERMKGGS